MKKLTILFLLSIVNCNYPMDCPRLDCPRRGHNLYSAMLAEEMDCPRRGHNLYSAVLAEESESQQTQTEKTEADEYYYPDTSVEIKALTEWPPKKEILQYRKKLEKIGIKGPKLRLKYLAEILTNSLKESGKEFNHAAREIIWASYSIQENGEFKLDYNGIFTRLIFYAHLPQNPAFPLLKLDNISMIHAILTAIPSLQFIEKQLNYLMIYNKPFDEATIDYFTQDETIKLVARSIVALAHIDVIKIDNPAVYREIIDIIKSRILGLKFSQRDFTFENFNNEQISDLLVEIAIKFAVLRNLSMILKENQEHSSKKFIDNLQNSEHELGKFHVMKITVQRLDAALENKINELTKWYATK